MDGQRKLLTCGEAADMLRIGRAHLYCLLGSGALSSIKIGKSRRIPVASVDAYITARLLEAQQPDGPKEAISSLGRGHGATEKKLVVSAGSLRTAHKR